MTGSILFRGNLPASPDDISVAMGLLELYLTGYQNPNTRRAYSTVLKQWAEWLGKPLEQATRADAIAYFSELARKQGHKARREGVPQTLTKGTLNYKRTILRDFYAFLEEQGVASASVFKIPIQAPEREPPKRPTEALPLEAVERLLTLPSEHTIEGKRDRAILSMMLYTGCRASEVKQCRIGHFKVRGDQLGELVSVNTKGGQSLTRILPREPSEAIERWRQFMISMNFKDGDFLFWKFYKDGRPWAPLGDKWLFRRFKGWCEQAGIDSSRISPHSARATVITKLLEEGFDHGAICAVTGHATLEMVRRYDKRFNNLKNSPALHIKWSAR